MEFSFSQYDKDENGNYNLLPKPNIDTGMGLERMAMVMENAKNIFEVKQINEVLKEVERVSKVSYGKDSEKDKSIRVITDHARAITFMVSDGILPSNEGRGYVQEAYKESFKTWKIIKYSRKIFKQNS